MSKRGDSQPVHAIDDAAYSATNLPSAGGENEVLKRNDTFLVANRHVAMGREGLGEHGLYHRGTRFLSRWELLIEDRYPMLMNSWVSDQNSALQCSMTTPEISESDSRVFKMGTIHVQRTHLIADGGLVERVVVTSYAEDPVTISLKYLYEADFRDIFEVRGQKRDRHGEKQKSKILDDGIVLGRQGLDDVMRYTQILFHGPISKIRKDACTLKLNLNPREPQTIEIAITCLDEQQKERHLNYQQADRQTKEFLKRQADACARIETSNPQLNQWLDRSLADLRLLTTEKSQGSYLYAGIPWFCTPFGRDGIIPALQGLWLSTAWARGALSYLSDNQADQVDEKNDAQPGKILHEVREGELAALGEIPFKKYYGTIDATPLFLMLAGHYFRQTRDRQFIDSIWPNILAAVNWIDEYGDMDGDGFIEYPQEKDGGLQQQGWKDSGDSLCHGDGSLPKGSIALCEVQGYVYEARMLIAEIARARGETPLADKLEQQANQLFKQFNAQFWVERLGTYAIALDGEKSPCEVINSNAGQALFTGIVSEKHAGVLVKTLLSPQSYSGWGIRTLGDQEVRYNPMSYHLGTVWPHDNSLIASGMSRYGFPDEARRVFRGLFDAANLLHLHRLPELFCGFSRETEATPILYPTACAPQAWSAGSVLLMLRSCLGIHFDGNPIPLRIHDPDLPDGVDWVTIQGLECGHSRVNLRFQREPGRISVDVENAEIEVTYSSNTSRPRFHVEELSI